MKLFATIFAAVLAAGLCLFGIKTCHRNSEKAIAAWQEQAALQASEIRHYLEKPGYNPFLDSYETTASYSLSHAPKGADTKELSRAIEDLRARKSAP